MGIVSSERSFLEALASELPQRKRESWVSEISAAKDKYDKFINDQYALGLKHSQKTEHLHPAVLCKEVHDFLYKGDIDPKQTVTGWGGWTIGTYAGRWLRAYRPGQEIVCPYQYGAIGPGRGDDDRCERRGAAGRRPAGCLTRARRPCASPAMPESRTACSISTRP